MCSGAYSRRLTFLAGALSAALLLLGAPVHAERVDVRVSWESGSGGDVAGYRIYTRYAGDVYDAGLDVGLPSGDGGAMSAVVKHVDGSQDSAFAVTAYWADGTESTLSNEGFTRAAGTLRPVCAELRCDSSGCASAASPDGLGCFDGDPCAVGVCAAGACVASGNSPALNLEVSKFQVTRAAHNRKRLVARAQLPLGTAIAEPFQDATIEVRDASTGVLFYQAFVRGSDFALKRGRSTFVYRGKRRRGHAPSGVNGLKHVGVRIGEGGSELTVRASAVDLARLAGDDALTLVVRLGDRCAQAAAIACGPMKHGRMRCH